MLYGEVRDARIQRRDRFVRAAQNTNENNRASPAMRCLRWLGRGTGDIAKSQIK
jgi:hypothetical protein